MDIEIPIIFLILAFLCFIIALIEERDKEDDDEEEEIKSSHLTIVMLIASLIFFAVGGVCMRMVTVLYYTSVTNTVEEVYLSSYTPLSWIGYGFSFLVGFFLLLKVYEQIDFRIEEIDSGE